MKAIRILTIILASISVSFIGCTEDEPELSKGERNASLLNDLLNEYTIKWVDIYEYNFTTGKWSLAADNQSYTEGMDLCHVEGTYFYLNGTGSKTYTSDDIPTHQWSGSYYFNLEYLVSFDLGSNNDELYLYFKY